MGSPFTSMTPSSSVCSCSCMIVCTLGMHVCAGHPAPPTPHHFRLIWTLDLELQTGAIQDVLWGVWHAPAVAACEQ